MDLTEDFKEFIKLLNETEVKYLRFGIIFIALLLPFADFAQSTSSNLHEASFPLLQNYYGNMANVELSKSIFSKNIDGKSKDYFINSDIFDQPSSILGPGTPKTAVFCRFENTLWHKFNIGVRLRVENPPKDY